MNEQTKTKPPTIPTLSDLAALTRADVDVAIAADQWTHRNPSLALWLNSAFAPATRNADALIADLEAHGVSVSE